ncbi:MAG TPA: 3-oxoacyl-[acyl-carrier-protein] synthase III C-terminal domain-containing protein [Actinospica sp.]|jgi:3-oxoacyl-[acyl-carrier-protein] synthase-3|nr:3-oxoacyl-[acyl-carrier-protein] synthase III C-terminal domain-containing protein [Actinospica sp.]
MSDSNLTDGIGIGHIHCLLPTELTEVSKLPENEAFGSAELDFVRGCGIETVGVIEQDAGPLATQAVTELMAQGAAEPEVILLVAGRAPDVLLGSEAARIQSEAKLGKAFALTVDGMGCVGSSAAWSLGADLLRADPSRSSVLIAHASRPTGPDRVRPPVTVVGDGAFAMTLVRGGRPVLRAHRAETDGSFHDLFEVRYKEGPWYEWREECADPDRYRFELALHSRLRLGRLVEQVLEDAGTILDQVGAVLMQNVTQSAYSFYRDLLGAEIHPVCGRNLARYGHLGAMDVVLNLRDLLAEEAVQPGELVLVLNNSPVAAWAATLWEV